MRKVVLPGLVLAAVLGILASSTSAAPAETGVSAKTITIGGTFPLTGPASLYATIPSAMKAYFSFINSRKGPDGKRGVYGRQIVFKVYDDGYNPAQSVQLARRLVEQDQVFAMLGPLGTEVNTAIRPYLNSKKVPHLLVSAYATTFYNEYKQWPWTTGWAPPYQHEGRIYGQSIARNSPNAKIAILYQNDDYGKDYIKGFEAGLGAKTSNIVAREGYEVTASDVRSQVAKLRASGANVLVIFATPKFTVQAYVIANALGWKPNPIYTNNVSATDTFLSTAQKSGAGTLVDNTFTVKFTHVPGSPSWDNSEGMKLYRDVMGRYYPGGRVTDELNLYGVAVAHAFVQLLYKAGKSPTRQGIMNAARNWNEPNPFLLPGNMQRTSGDDQYPVGCERVAKFSGGTFKLVSDFKCVAAGGV